MIVKSGEGKTKEFLGVSFDVLAVGEMSMVTKMNFKRDIVPLHRHSNEQSGFVISGKLRFIFGQFDDFCKQWTVTDNISKGEMGDEAPAILIFCCAV